MAIKKTKTVCTTCDTRCGAIVYSDENNQIIRIEGDPDHPVTKGKFCASGMSEREIHNDTRNRILYPMKRKTWSPSEPHTENRGKDEYERVSWDEALDLMTEKVKQLIDDYGVQSVIIGQGTGRTTDHWHGRFNSTIGQSGWSLSPLHVCMIPGIIPGNYTFGRAGYEVGDLPNARTMVIWGVNPVFLNRNINEVLNNRENGAKCVVIDIRFTELAMLADVFLQPLPGTDAALALGMMNVIIENDWYDKEWIEKWTYGFDELKERVAQYPLERCEEITGCPKEKIYEAAKLMATETPASFAVNLGATAMHTNAIQNGRAIVCLEGLLGQIDVPGGEPMDPYLDVMLNDKMTLWDDPERAKIYMFGQDELPLHRVAGNQNHPYYTFNAIVTGEPKPVKAYVAVGNDPLLCYENTNLTYEALTSPNLEMLVTKDFYITSPTCAIADIVLPAADWSERDSWDEGMYMFELFATPKAVDPPGDIWDDWKFWLEWGKRFDPEIWPWKDAHEMQEFRLNANYGIDLSWEEFMEAGHIDLDEHANPVYKKYEKGLQRQDGQPGFETPTGRFEFYCTSLPSFGYDPLPDYEPPYEVPDNQPELAKEYPLTLSAGHRLFAFYHAAWSNVAAQRHIYPDPFAVINPETAKENGITEGEWIRIESPRGSIKAKAHVSYEVTPGIVACPRVGWRDECPELGLPGYGWDGANPNILVPSTPTEPHFGCAPMRSSMCRIVKETCND